MSASSGLVDGPRPYHHGGLRLALLTEAERTLRESGVEGLSLRQLARDVGVSHGAPRRHFRDKAALVNALAIDGFVRLSAVLEQVARAGLPFRESLTAAAVAYVTFATDNAALLELMFASKHQAEVTPELQQASTVSFDSLAAMVQLGQSSGELVEGDLDQIGTVFFALLQGVTSLANTDMVDRAQLDQLTRFAVHSLLEGLAPAATRGS